MKEQDFFEQIKKPDRFRNVVNYIICVSMLLGGLFIFYKFFQSLKLNRPISKLIFPALFFSTLGSYGLWRISKDFKVLTVASNQSLDQKIKVIDEYLETINVISLRIEEDMYKIQYRNRYWNSVDINIAFDHEFYYLNAKATANGFTGMIDFGLTTRARKKLERFFGSKACI